MNYSEFINDLCLRTDYVCYYCILCIFKVAIWPIAKFLAKCWIESEKKNVITDQKAADHVAIES
jgi:hypothetical protein